MLQKKKTLIFTKLLYNTNASINKLVIVIIKYFVCKLRQILGNHQEVEW